MTRPPKKANQTKAPMTYEERVADAWKRGRPSRSLEYIPPVTPGRELKIGMAVEIGNLQDCVVADMSEDGRFVVIDYTRVDNNYGRPIRYEHQLDVWSWLECLPLEGIEETHFARKKHLRPAYLNGDIGGLIHKVMFSGVVDNPDYQREYVWTTEDKVKLIDSVFNERSIGSFLFVEYPFAKYKGAYEVLDGKQRINALIEFYSGKFPYQGKYYHQLSRQDRGRFMGLHIQHAELDGVRMSRSDMLELFLDVNTAGVPQSEEHIAKVKALLNEARAAEKHPESESGHSM